MITFSERRTEASQLKAPDEKPNSSAASRGWPAKFSDNSWKVAHIGRSALSICKQQEALLYHGENMESWLSEM